MRYTQYIVEKDRDLPIGMLSGVAQYQNYWNHQGYPWKLQIMMVNDYNATNSKRQDKNEERTADNAVNFIAKNKNVLAVIGHYNSGTTIKYLEKYNTEKLTLVSGTNTVTDINQLKNDQNKASAYYFRNAATIDSQVEKISEYLKKNQLSNINVFVGDGRYATAYLDSLKKSKDINIKAIIYQQSTENTGMNKVADQTLNSQPQSLILIPDPFLGNTEDIKNLISSIQTKSPGFPIIGTETLARNSFWRFLKDDANTNKNLNLSLIIPSVLEAQKPTQVDLSFIEENPIYHRTISTYEAMQVLIDAINQAEIDVKAKDSPSNKQGIRPTLPQYIRKITKEKKYSGITGVVIFNEQGDRYTINKKKEPEELRSTITKVEFNNQTNRFDLIPVKE